MNSAHTGLACYDERVREHRERTNEASPPQAQVDFCSVFLAQPLPHAHAPFSHVQRDSFPPHPQIFGASD